MTTRGSSREPIAVDEKYRYVAGDALRTVGAVGALWAHHTHGGGIEPHLIQSVATQLRDDIARHAGISTIHDDPQTCFDDLGNQLSTRFDELSNAQLAAVISSMWARTSQMRSNSRTAAARVASLHVSRGGVPKAHVDSVDVNISGVDGDKQANRTHHGRPWQAVCIWSRDIVDAFATAGHPIGAGYAGENVSVSGIDWSLVRPGTIIDIGSASIRVTAYSIPCKHNAAWFADRDFMAMSHERGWVSRVYGLVLQPGHARVGDSVTLHH